MGSYTEKAYEISLSRKVFLDNNKEPIKSQEFNMFSYFSLYFKKFINLFGCEPEWSTLQQFEESSDEICQQLDITYILRKMQFLDSAV